MKLIIAIVALVSLCAVGCDRLSFCDYDRFKDALSTKKGDAGFVDVYDLNRDGTVDVGDFTDWQELCASKLD